MVQDKGSPLLDPLHLSRIEDLSLLARVVVEGNYSGLHRSRKHGQGTEFFQYRSYEPGEDLKRVDWKVYAKSKHLVSKTYQESTHSNLILVLDGSASMGYQGDGSACSKFRYSQMLAACLLYLGYRQGDRLGLLCGSKSRADWMFPHGGRESFNSILKMIGSMHPNGEDFEEPAWNQFKSKLPSQGTVVVISDFLENENQLEKYLNFASSNRYDCICFQVIDPMEEVLPQDEAVRFIHMEGEGEVSLSPERIRNEYKARFSEYIDKLGLILAKTGAELCTLRTNEDLGFAIRRFLSVRGIGK